MAGVTPDAPTRVSSARCVVSHCLEKLRLIICQLRTAVPHIISLVTEHCMHVTEHCTLAGTHIGALEFPSALLPSRLSAYVLPRLYMHILASPTSLTVAYASAATNTVAGRRYAYICIHAHTPRLTHVPVRPPHCGGAKFLLSSSSRLHMLTAQSCSISEQGSCYSVAERPIHAHASP